ncbi:Late embryogenesis abundant protein, LEA-14 [Artemisia annua]|uniref:Late embryogenesis abundant protein, LEA-14 n=1 Tax=Artemisia annua TaxID=35608 RepID=A0A2U1KWS4_ARTAN|nr:Late embryogenesis abundant protein, LEA-14 [Artemisia annua]
MCGGAILSDIIAPNRSRRLTSADLLWNTDNNNSYFSSKANVSKRSDDAFDGDDDFEADFQGFKDHHDKPSFVFSSKHPSATAAAKATQAKPKQQKQAPKVNHTDISEYPGSFDVVEEKPQHGNGIPSESDAFYFSPNEGSNSFDCSEFPWGETCPKTPEITSLLSELDEATFMEEANPAKKPKMEIVDLVSDCEKSDDDLFFEMPYLQGAWDASSVDAFLNGDSNQDCGNVMDLWSFDDLPPRRPIFSFQTLNITSYKFDVTESSALFVSAVASMTLVAQNPNRVGIRYDFSRLKILDDGLVVGMIRIPGFYQPARSHNVSVEIDIFFECLDITPIMSGVKTNNFTVKVVGDIGVHLRLLQIKLPKIKVGLDCDVAVDGRYLTSADEINSLQAVNNHVPRRPIFSFQTLNITSYKFDVTESSALFVSAVASMTLVAQNPNRVGIRYDFSRLKILDDGLVVGMIRIPGFYQPARSHNVSVEIDIFFECLDITPIMSGVKTNNFTVKVVGDIGVHLRLLQIKLPKIKVGLDCDVAVDGRYLTSADEINSLQAVNNHVAHFNANSQAFSKKCSIGFYF